MNVKEALEQLLRINDKKIWTYDTQGAAAISLTTTVAKDFPNRRWRVKQLDVTFSAAPTTSESLTVTRTSGTPATVFFSTNPSLTSATSIYEDWSGHGPEMMNGEEVIISFTNTDTKTIRVRLTIEVK